MHTCQYEIRQYAENGLPCFCHFGYRNAGDAVFYSNRHRDIEIVLCTGGEGYMENENEIVPFAQGDIVVANSDTSHIFLTNSHVEYYFLILSPRFHLECGYAPEDVSYEKKIQDPQLCAIFERIIEITHTDEKYRTLKTRLECSRLLLAMLEGYATLSDKAGESPSALHAKKGLEYLMYNYASAISVEAVASYAGIGRSRLAREFKQYTGQTVLEKLNQIRCQQAKALIEGGESITRAAVRCGFDNSSYFTKTYKKVIGELPTETKKKRDNATS